MEQQHQQQEAVQSELPPDVLQLVLRCVLRHQEVLSSTSCLPRRSAARGEQHLMSAAQVCSAWRAAAAAVSEELAVDMSADTAAARHARAASLSAYLQRHGTCVSCLAVSGAPMSRATLATPAAQLARLRDLSIASCRLELLGSSSSSGAGQQPQQQALTSLQLKDCLISCSLAPSAAAGAARGLQRLQLQQVAFSRDLEGQLSSEGVLSSLLDLRQLTHLTLEGVGVQQAPLLAALGGCLARMPQLLELRLALPYLMAASLADLPPSLTLLQVEGAQCLELTARQMPGVTALRSLQSLSVEGARAFEPRLLAHMPRMTSLRVRCCSSRWKPDGFAGTQHLLEVMPQLPLLQTLDLRNALQHIVYAPQQPHQPHQHPQQQQPLPAYAALTASASQHLTALDVSGCRFPPGACSLLFPPGRQLPALRRLLLYRVFDPQVERLQPLDVGAIVAGCPALRELSLFVDGRSQRTARLDSLAALADTLEDLTLAGRGVTSAFVCRTLAPSLTRLQSLQLFGCPGVGHVGLQALQSLSHLTYLLLESCGLTPQLTNEPGRLELEAPAAAAAGSADSPSSSSDGDSVLLSTHEATPPPAAAQGCGGVARQLQGLFARLAGSGHAATAAGDADTAVDLLQLIFDTDIDAPGAAVDASLQLLFGGVGGGAAVA